MMGRLSERYGKQSGGELRSFGAKGNLVPAWSERSWEYLVKQLRTSKLEGTTSRRLRCGSSRPCSTATSKTFFPMYRTGTVSRKSIRTRLRRKEAKKLPIGRRSFLAARENSF